MPNLINPAPNFDKAVAVQNTWLVGLVGEHRKAFPRDLYNPCYMTQTWVLGTGICPVSTCLETIGAIAIAVPMLCPILSH